MSFFETGDLAVVSEKWWETKLERKWLLNFQGPDLLKAEKVLFSERSYEDKYSDPGNIQYGYSQLGTKCPLQMRRDLGQQKVTIFLYNDEGAGEEGYVPFLNIVEIDLENLNDSDRLASEKSKGNTNTVKTGIVTQIWESNHEAGKFERIHAVLNNSGSTLLSGDSLRVILSQETPEEPPNYYLYDLNFLYVAGVVKKVSDESAVRITNFKHPYPAMKGYSKHIIKYKRPLDGVTLSSTLYLPKGYSFDLENIQTDRKKSKLKKEKRLPLLFWAYPLQYNAASAAGQLRDSPFRFSKVTPFKSPLVWLTLGFAVLDGPSMPIIATGDKSSNANDTYVEQLVSSAEAAVDYVCNGLGICDSTRVAVGGHSYGAFMVANLLIHSKNLFCCGIARSGAYNRTMTPFGFQTERRSFWKVPKIYTKMSPFFTLHKDMRPILLIHGAEDENRGTYTDQSVRMFAALRSIGVVSRLVVLPYEGHRYRARESIMHCLAETEFWLRKYCVDKRKYSTSYDVAPDELRSATAPIATIATHIQPGDSQVNL
uniref:Peptidase S9 prolyl oligopeptidase catalytic domain-containing protein n=1 Tax=Aplanochytrium stocchinoi TaxID=215587 RepID=A0A7S3PLQ8_9STRA